MLTMSFVFKNIVRFVDIVLEKAGESESSCSSAGVVSVRSNRLSTEADMSAEQVLVESLGSPLPGHLHCFKSSLFV